MTLALYGKSRRRQLALITIGVFVALAAMAAGLSALTGTQRAFAADTLFSDSFGSAAAPTVPSPWTDSDGAGTNAQVIAGFNSSPSSYVLFLRANGTNVHAGVDTSGYTNINIAFTCHGDIDNNDSGDDLGVDISTNGGSSWSEIAGINANQLANGCQVGAWSPQSIPVATSAASNNPNFRIRFRAKQLNGGSESVSVDDVVVTGDPIPPLYELVSVTPNTGAPATAAPGASVPVSLRLKLNGTDTADEDWQHIQWGVGTTEAFQGCTYVGNNDPQGQYTENFNVTAPAGQGTYNLYLRAWSDNNGCNDTSSEVFVVTNAITVAPPPNDQDGDGVPDLTDACPDTPPGFAALSSEIDSNGCSPYDLMVTHNVPTPPLQGTCGPADFNFVVDASGSVGGDFGTMISNVQTFVTSYETASGNQGLYALTMFSSDGSFRSNFVTGTTLVNTSTNWANIGSYTNTEDGIRDALGATGGRSGVPKIMFVITDGAPNRWRNGGSPSTGLSSTWLNAANAAIPAADTARSAPNGYIVKALYVDQDLNGDTSMSWAGSDANRVLWSQKVMTGIGGGSYSSLGAFSQLLGELLLQSGCTDLTINKVVNEDIFDQANNSQDVSYTITVKNVDENSVTGADVNDPLPGTGIFDWNLDSGPAECSIQGNYTGPETLVCTDLPTLAPQGEYVITISAPIPAGDICGQYDNTATLSFIDDAQQEIEKTASDSFTVTNCAPPTGTISGSKYQDLDGNGGNETTNPLSGWTFNLIDAGQNTVDSDTTVAGGSFSFANVTPGTYELCEVPQAGWTPTDPSTGCRTVVVTAGQDTVANFWNFQLQDITLTKTAETTWKRNNDWTIEKVVSDSDESEQASVTVNLNDGNSETVTWKVTATKTTTHSATVYGSVTITNPNPIALSVTTLTDVYDDTAASFTDCSFPKSVPANDSVVCAYTINLPDDASPPNGTNTVNATVAAPYADLTDADGGSATVTFTGPDDTGDANEIDVTDNNPHTDAPWNDRTSTFTETYTQSLDCSTVVYDQQGRSSYQIDNTATITQTGDNDSASVLVNCRLPLEPLTVTKTGAGSYDRDINWTIEKTANPTSLNLDDDETGDVDYAIEVVKTTWYRNITVTGSIFIQNTNDIAITVSSLDDELSSVVPGGTASPEITTVACETPFDVPANTTVKCDYTYTYPDSQTLPTDVVNTATATAQNTALSDSGTANISFTFSNNDLGEPNSITVDDVNDEKGTTTHGPAAAKITLFTPTETYGCPDNLVYTNGVNVRTVSNTATINETIGDSDDASVEITCTQRPGSLTLNKIVDWGDTVNPPASNPSFQFCLVGIGGTASPVPSCKATTGGSLTWSNLVPGSYRLDETVPAGWQTDLGSIVDPDSFMFTIDPGENQDLGDVTNTYHPGSLTVTKTVDLNGADPSEAPENVFEICVSSDDNGSYPDVPSCKNITGNTSETWSGLLPGTYTVNEVNQSSQWTVVVNGDTAGNPQVAVATGQEETAEVVNTLKRARFMIQKSFLWNGVPLANQPGESFYICIKGPSFPSGTSAGACKVVSTTDTAPIILLWEDLIPGNYMVGEFQGQGFNTTPVDNDPAWEVTISPTQYDLNPGENPGNAHVLVDNEYQLAGLVVTKVVDWGEQVEDNTQTFTICIEGPSYTLPADAAEACQDADSNGGALTWTNLIPGDYTVTENDPGAEWGVSGDDVTVDAPAGGQGKHTITNTILEGDLNVVKTIAWNGAPGDASQTFEICIQGPTYPNGNETGACQDVNPGNTTAQWKDLEIGAYTVTENFPDGDSAEWTTTVDGVSGTTGSATVATGTPARVEIVNTLRRGRVIVHKLYDFPGGTPDSSWQPVVTVNGDSAKPNGLHNWDPVDVPANQPIDVTELLPDGWTNVDITFEGHCGQQTPESVIDNLINQALSLVGLDVGVLSAELAGDTVMVTPGGDCEVTFENRAVGTVEVTKVDQTTAGGTWNFDLNAPERDGEDTLDEQFSIVGDGTKTETGVPAGDYSVTETNPGEYGSIEECPEPNPNGEGVYTTVATPFGTSIDEPGKLIRFVFTNTSCPVVLATGNLVIEKWNDVDGDGNRDAGEDPIGGWEVTVTGPQFPGGATFTTESNPNDLNFGRIILAGIYSGSYNVTEEDPSGWYVTGLIVDGSGKSPSTTTNVEVMDDSLSSYNDAVVEFGNRETASVRVTKVVNDQVGNADRSGWVFTLTGCGILKTASTGASGVILWENLVPCLYTVREAGANQDGFTTSPSAQQSVRPGPGETAEVTFTNSRLPETTPPPSSTPPTNTPTATPVMPTSTPTEPPVEPTNTPTPVETVAGEKTPGPGNQATPIPPDTGSGLGGGATGSSMLLVILGLAAVTAGAGFVSLGRKRR